MAKITAQSGSLVTKNKEQEIAAKKDSPKNLKELLEARMPEFEKLLPSVISGKQFLRLALNALQSTPHLKECTVMSFYGAIMQCAQLGLKPNVNGEAHLSPFFNNKIGKYECQFIVGYKGLMSLARRSGEISIIDAHEVRENDKFEIEFGFEPKVVHVPCLKGDRGAIIGYYAIVVMKDGGKLAHYMTVDEAEKYGKRYSKTFNNGPWKTDFDAMAKKSCLRQELKYAPTSTDVDSALKTDEHTLKYDETATSDVGNIIDITDDDISEVPAESNTEEKQAGADGGIAVDSETGETLERVPDEE